MVHDYAGRIKTSKKKKPFMLWMLMSVGAMVVMGSIIYFKLTHFSLPPTPSVQKKLPVLVQIPKKTLPKLQFEFYTLLTQKEPETVTAEQQVVKVVTEQKIALAHEPSAQFMVQLAAFNNQAEAERMRASLALKGVSTQVIAGEQGAHQWYRVIAGPFGNREEAVAAQNAIIKKEGIRGMIRKA